MALKISKTNAPAYDYYSEGDGTDPVASTAAVSGTGGSAVGAVVTAYLVATTYNYTDIAVTPAAEETGINWQVSLDNATWLETVSPADMDATSADQVVTIYLRPTVANDGSVTVGSYTACNVSVTALASL
jgi:hypothetical protein